MRKIYLTNNGLHEILEGQDDLIQEDWVKCELDENRQPYTKYLSDGKPDLVEIEKILNEDLIQDIKNNFKKNEPLKVTVTLFDGTAKDIIFDTASTSAIAIETSIKLSQDLNESSTKIWDINNIVYEFTIAEATIIKNIIAKAYRDRILERQRLISLVA